MNYRLVRATSSTARMPSYANSHLVVDGPTPATTLCGLRPGPSVSHMAPLAQVVGCRKCAKKAGLR